MATRKRSAANPTAKHATPADTGAAVDAFLRGLEPGVKRQVAAIRKAMLAVDPAIQDGIKWNAPSWRTTEYFATTHLRDPRGIGVILHLGAKARRLPAGGLGIEDPDGLLEWLGKDRARIVFTGATDLQRKRAALQRIVRQWIVHV